MPYLGPAYCEVPPGYLKQMALHYRFPLLYWRPEPDPRSYVLFTVWVDTTSFVDVMRDVKTGLDRLATEMGERIGRTLSAFGASAADILRGGIGPA